ncbi:tyrosine-protein phosphatase [Agromyces sp. SYSU T00194]|uniref:tyrosine-protein phosphatase n=1 Tax=Agromyces chitinivorans TaxID=3158560 RepID=UPI00339B707F
MRALEWDGYPNCRDLGGLPLASFPGTTTVVGRVARGPRRERLTTAGWAQAHGWGVRSIIDLRSSSETGVRPGDPVVDDAARTTATVMLRPTEDQTDPEFRRRCLPILDSPEYWAHNWELQPGLVRNALEAIATAEPGVLVHCSAGRDRTGMITTLLLGNAGVSAEAIVDDYSASVLAMAGTGASPHDRMASWTTAQVEAWLVGAAPIVHAVAGRASEVLAQLGVGARTRARLRQLLLP